MSPIAAFLVPLRLERHAEKYAEAGYPFADDLLAATPDELDLLCVSLTLRKPEERRFREAVEVQTNQSGQNRGGVSRRSTGSDSQPPELVAELMEPLQLGRFAKICTSKGYSFAKDVIGSDDEELAQLLRELGMKPPEERRLRKYLGRPPVPADPALAAAQKEQARVAIEEARAAAEEAEAAELEAQKKAEEKAARKAAKKGEFTSKLLQLLLMSRPFLRDCLWLQRCGRSTRRRSSSSWRCGWETLCAVASSYGKLRLRWGRASVRWRPRQRGWRWRRRSSESTSNVLWLVIDGLMFDRLLVMAGLRGRRPRGRGWEPRRGAGRRSGRLWCRCAGSATACAG